MDTALPCISPVELAARLGRPDAPLLLDVRRPEHFAASSHRVAGAIRCAPDALDAFAAATVPQEVVVYCVHGHKVSADALGRLRAAGWDARLLAGGLEGGEPGVDPVEEVARWRAAPLPRVRKRPDLGVTGERPSRWITRKGSRIDGVACPWLVLRFLDPRARFFHVAPDEVSARAAQLEAIPFDVPGAEFAHAADRCSFDALLAAFELRMPALERLAAIVRGAAADGPAQAPQSAGLLAVSLGMSRLQQDDHRMLQATLPVYDALYAWCRDGQGEAPGWLASRGATR